MGELGVHPFSDGMKSNTGITNAPLTLSLPRLINLKFLLQHHQQYNIKQFEEFGFL